MKKPTKAQIRERLEWVKAQITKCPEKYDQSSFCGTPCCIAGWLDIKMVGVREHMEADARNVWRDALAALGIPEFAATPWIFRPNFFGSDKFQEFFRARNKKQKARVACRAIDAYLKEIGADAPKAQAARQRARTRGGKKAAAIRKAKGREISGFSRKGGR